MHAAVEAVRTAAGDASPPRARTTALPPLSLYVHFPWCVRKCPYCDFNSHTLRGRCRRTSTSRRCCRTCSAQSSAAAGRPVQSIFLGGGTPSLFSPAASSGCCRRRVPGSRWSHEAEITLEANPGTVERGRFADYRAAGITRVSLGAQSFSDASLQILGRIHSAAETRRAAEELHAAGLGNFNLDLMYGLPDQDAAAGAGGHRERARAGAKRISPTTSSPWSQARCLRPAHRRDCRRRI